MDNLWIIYGSNYEMSINDSYFLWGCPTTQPESTLGVNLIEEINPLFWGGSFSDQGYCFETDPLVPCFSCPCL